MKTLLYVYQNYRNSYSSAALSILRGLDKVDNLSVSSFEIKPLSFNHNLNRVLNRLPLLKTLNFNRQNSLLINEVNKGNYDYVFVMKGTDLKYETLRSLKANNPDVIFLCFNPDDPFNQASSNQDILDSIKLYDYYCIWTHLLKDKLKANGANRIIYFPFGVDEKIIYPVEAEYEFDISFIGNGDSERHSLISALASELRRRGHEMKVHIFGSNWPKLGENVMVHEQRNGKDLLRTIASSKLNLNLLRKQNKGSINMRTFEIPAANGFMIHEKSQEATDFFKEDDEVVYFNSIEDLVDKCVFYLNNNEERLKCINECRKRITNGSYSYKKIVQDNLSKL